jgi:hypothetical protein
MGWNFFTGRYSGLASSFVSETQLRVYRGWKEMTATYLENHVSPRGEGEGGGGFQMHRDENSLVIFISAVYGGRN